MKHLVWCEKLQRIKAFSIRKETSGFIHEECFNTHIPKSVFMEMWQRGRLRQTVNLFLTARWFESIRLHQV